VFTGSIYGPQADALRNVLQATLAFPGGGAELWLYTNERAEDLADLGLAGERLRVNRTCPVVEVPEVLGQADILVLPFSFDLGQKDIVASSYPTKTADYLASGVPILVHAPPYATISRIARAEGWAEVVDSADPDRLVQAVRRLVEDRAHRRMLVQRALMVARARHDLSRSRSEFVASLTAAAGMS
jgi:glycosyltransferase involved in cell wall biosynthesis